jgi:DNA-binding response OmpR family regulator
MIRLLFVEDDANMCYIIKSSLEEIVGGYEVTAAGDGMQGLEMFTQHKPDVIVSDIEMPKMDGYEMVRTIRRIDKDIPIIFATAKGKPSEVGTGYDAGVDMYIKKPFAPEEIDRHVRSLMHLKALRKDNPVKYEIGIYTFDSENFVLTNGANKHTLTAIEAKILKILCENKGAVVKREQILKLVWHDDHRYISNSLNVFIYKLRRYFADDKTIRITSLKGVGLILEEIEN